MGRRTGNNLRLRGLKIAGNLIPGIIYSSQTSLGIAVPPPPAGRAGRSAAEPESAGRTDEAGLSPEFFC